MNLTDHEILELNELCGAVVDETINEVQRARLSRWLVESEPARQYYVRALALSASLHSYAGEMQSEAPDKIISRPQFAVAAWWAGSLAAAALVVLALWSRTPPSTPTAPAADYVARLTAAKDTRWTNPNQAPKPGEHLRKGQHLELAAGRAEITFDSGARVVLEGPASLDINSAWDSNLRRGTLTASVPPEAIGFRISNTAVEVVDLGTEFTMIADTNGSTEVLVLKGEVEAAPRTDGNDETILLRENESRRFARSGVSAVSDSERKIARFMQPTALDRFSPLINFAHWSFDELSGTDVLADSPAPALNAAARLTLQGASDLAAVRTVSPHGRALAFDGRLQASGRVPGISGPTPRTVAFWVKVPKDAATDAWMVSWNTVVKKLNSRPVQISWNRRPGEGSFGALRTDFGGGYAIGAQDLRDGRWHHVAVCFTPGDTPEDPVQVKQYIDGRLESSTITLTPGTTRVSPSGGYANAATGTADILWLGCRLTGKQPEYFRGELDELFIADRGLEPHEIVSLMTNNRLPDSALAALR
jgi:ferric-dicitrate binding protein FerR (iron transport regulator)